MAISDQTIQDHIARWVQFAKRSSIPYRQHWPARLFRHEPVENAACILRAGQLLSRVRARGLAPKDIADKQVIASQDEAHESARLYFRPKNPTQYYVEGIRKPEEYYHGDPDTHAPILVMLIFRADRILTRPGIRFSDGNMQSPRTSVFSEDQEFRELPFEAIYHVGSIEPGSDIIRQRCAEVLIPDQLPLEGCLQGVICRSPAERATLLHLLGDEGETWAPRIRVYTEPGIFENRHCYVDRVSVASEEVSVTLHARSDVRPVKLDIYIHLPDGKLRRFVADQAAGSGPYRCKITLPPGAYLVEVKIDDLLAYQAVSLIDELPF